MTIWTAIVHVALGLCVGNGELKLLANKSDKNLGVLDV